MQILPTFVLAAGAAIQLLQSPTRSDSVLVRNVVDGDTIDVSTLGRVRLLGIDAPELAHGYDSAAPFAREAKERLASLILHHWVRLEQEGTRLDVYDRRLAYVVREDGMFVNAVLVRDGLARVTARLPLSRLPELQRAEAEAQAFRRGMWGATPPIQASGYTRRSSAVRGPRVRAAKPRASRPTTSKARKRKRTEPS
jgi:micrococcal nuclease